MMFRESNSGSLAGVMVAAGVIARTRLKNGIVSGGSFQQHPSWSTSGKPKFGVVDYVASPTNLYIDVDRAVPPKLSSILQTLRAVRVRPVWACYRRSAHGWHIIIKSRNRIHPGEQIALQILLGSDRRRETLNLMRLLSISRHGANPYWRKRWNILYRYKLRREQKRQTMRL